MRGNRLTMSSMARFLSRFACASEPIQNHLPAVNCADGRKRDVTSSSVTSSTTHEYRSVTYALEIIFHAIANDLCHASSVDTDSTASVSGYGPNGSTVSANGIGLLSFIIIIYLPITILPMSAHDCIHIEYHRERNNCTSVMKSIVAVLAVVILVPRKPTSS